MRKLMVVATCMLLLAVGCSGSRKPSATTEPTSVASGTPSPSATPCSVPGASTLDATSTSSNGSAALSDVRYSDDGCASVVFEFKDHVPGFKIGYAQGPFSDCGSGQAVATDTWGADQFLQIKLTPAGGADAGTGKATYTGPRDITVDKQTLKHLKVTCDFEADLTWLVGLRNKHAFKVSKFDTPARIVVTIAQNASSD